MNQRRRATDVTMFRSEESVLRDMLFDARQENAKLALLICNQRETIHGLENRDTPPWLPELLEALQWSGGTIHQAIAAVKRLAADPAALNSTAHLLATHCRPPTHHAFDIDIYDCPCGHMYGDHEYRTVNREMRIDHCTKCGARP